VASGDLTPNVASGDLTPFPGGKCHFNPFATYRSPSSRMYV